MTLATVMILFGLILLIWGADRFVVGATAVADGLGMPPLLIGMIIVGFGTSTPELLVSGIAAAQGNPGIALGNAYGSNITNIALILGLTALISPISVHSSVLRKELPILTLVTAVAVLQLWDNHLSRLNAAVLLLIFAGYMAWTIWLGLRQRTDSLAREVEIELAGKPLSLRKAWLWLVIGLLLLMGSSRMLVWGAVEIATQLGVADLIIGLTVVAVGTSLPELASSLMAIRKGEHDIALGNVIGSNLFNTLAVVGIAGMIHPFQVAAEVLTRDLLVMSLLTLAIFFIGYGVRGPGRINRLEGAILLAAYLAYTTWLVRSA